MNKKFSTLVAVLLAAGSFVTVSAVVDILEKDAPTVGQSYAIGTGLNVDGKAVLLTVSGSETSAVAKKNVLSGKAGANGTAFVGSSHWEFVGENIATSVKLAYVEGVEGVEGDVVRYLKDDLSLTAIEGEGADFKLASGKLVVVSEGEKKNKELKLATSISLEAAGSGTAVVFVGSAGSAVAADGLAVDTEYAIATAADLTQTGTIILTNTFTPAVDAYNALEQTKSATVNAAAPVWTVKAGSEGGFTLANEDGYVAIIGGKLVLVAKGGTSVPAEFTYVNGELVTKDGEADKEIKITDFLLAAYTEDVDNVISFAQWSKGAGDDVTEEPTATTPIMIRLGDNYLVLGQDIAEKTVVTTKASATYDLAVPANVNAATWYVEGGKFRSFANGKYLAAVVPAQEAAAVRAAVAPDVAAAGFALVDTKEKATTFKAYTGETATTDNFANMAKLGFDNKGTPTFFTAAGVTETTYSSAATSNLTIASVPTPLEAAVKKIVADDYYMLAVGADKFIASADGQTIKTATDINNAPSTFGLTGIWKVTETPKSGGYQYTFTNAKDEVLKLNARGDFASATTFSYETQGGAMQLTLAGKNIEAAVDGKISAVEGGTLATFGLFTAPEAIINGKTLTEVLGGGFDLTVAMKSDYTETDIEGNPFNGILTPMKEKTVGTAKTIVAADAGTDKDYFLKNSDGEYIVLDTKDAWSSSQDGMNGANSHDRGYKFTTLSEADFLKMLVGADKEATDMKAQYKYSFSVACKGDPNKAVKALFINVLNSDVPKSIYGKVYTASFGDEHVMTTSNKLNTTDDRTENWPYIKFGGNGLVASSTFLGKAVNVAYVHSGAHGQADDNQDFSTAGRRVDGNWVPVDTTYTQFDKPEGQWMVTKSVNAGEFTLVNRESRATVNITGLYTTPVSNVYAAVTVAGANGNAAKNAQTGKSDTLQITIAPAYEKTTGYANFDTTSLKVRTFTMAVSTVLDGNVYSTEPDNGHKVGLSKDVEEAAQWRLVKFELGNKVKNKPYNSAKNDTIKSSIDILDAKGEKTASTDSLYAFAYAFRNDATNEFLKYDADKRAFIVDKDSKNYTAANYDAVEKFLLKEERNGTYQIIPTGIDSKIAIPQNSKLYGAFSELKIDQTDKSIYEITNNDLFVIDDVNAPLYIGAANAPELSFNDTVKIFKESNNNVVLYERGNFLGMQHVADVAKMAPAMFVDTAFVRNNTYKPQYLLAVRHELIYHNDDCDIPGHDPILTTNVDTVKASYLVNMVDSAKAFGLDKHNNPYVWENTSSFKLAFVDGYHTNDSLYFAKKDAKNAVVKDAKGAIVYDRIFLGNNENRIGKYAFRIVDRSTNAFIIETSYDGTDKIGYIKWLNGTPAVVETIDQAEVFNMLATEENPTDNEGIETTEVSVIAGAGQVVINNAAGKAVAISNILGQTLANTVLTSDNATISVPAGIVVVAVEGEAAVKAIIK